MRMRLRSKRRERDKEGRKRGGRPLWDQRVRSKVRVHRRRPWNGELCRLVQPAGSCWSLQRATKRIVCVPNEPSAKIGFRNKTTNAGPRRLLRFPTPAACVRRHTSVVRGVRSVGQPGCTKAAKIQPDTHVLDQTREALFLARILRRILPLSILTLPLIIEPSNALEILPPPKRVY